MNKSTFFTVDSFSAENYKGIKFIKCVPSGESIILIGKDGAGKTNCWQLIQMTLGNYPSAILTQGEDKGEANIVITNKEYKYEFDFRFNKEGDMELTTYQNGKRITKAMQTDVMKQLNHASFDLEALINTTGQKQADIIFEMLQIDVSKDQEAYKEAYERRAQVKKDLLNCSNFEKVEKVDRVEISDLMKEKAKIDEENNTVIEEEIARRQKHNDLIDLDDRISSALKDIIFNMEESIKIDDKGKNKRIETLSVLNGIKLPAEREKLSTGLQMVKNEISLKSTAEIDGKINNASLINKQADDYDRYLEKIETKKKAEKSVEEAEKNVKDKLQEILSKIDKAKMPVEGLKIIHKLNEASGRMSFELSYNGLPFDSDSINEGKRIAIAARLQMNMIKENELGVIFVNAGKIANTTMEQIHNECKAMGMQAIFERTSREDEPLQTVFFDEVAKKEKKNLK